MAESRERVSGAWSFIGTYGLVTYVAVVTGGFSAFKAGLWQFFTGDYTGLATFDPSLANAVPLCFASLAIDLPVTIVVATIVHNAFPRSKELTNAIATAAPAPRGKSPRLPVEKESGKQLFLTYFSIIMVEELLARWLFLGVLHPLLGGGRAMFYILFLLGNGIWALLHLGNYERKYGRSVWWVLPQFLGGILLTIIYMKHGFLVALVTHFAYDTLIWCLEKAQQYDGADVLATLVSIGYAYFSYRMMSKPLSDVLAWFEPESSLGLNGWGLWDYVWLMLFVHGVSGTIFCVLNYDHTGTSGKKAVEKKAKAIPPALAILIGAALVVFLGCLMMVVTAYITFWVCRSVTYSIPAAALIYGIWRCFNEKDESLSAMCRTFWGGIPACSVFVCAVHALPFWSAMGFVAAGSALLLPKRVCDEAAR